MSLEFIIKQIVLEKGQDFLTNKYFLNYISDYDNNVRNIKTDFPYIMAARLVPYIDTSSSTNPNRNRLSAADAGFGIAINREFTSIPDLLWSRK